MRAWGAAALGVMVGASAHAQTPSDSGDLGEAAARIREVVRSPEPSARTLEEAFAALHEEIALRTAPLSDDVWVPVLLDLTIARFQLDQDWKAPRTAAHWSRPDLPVPVGPSLRALRSWTPAPAQAPAALPYGRTVWLDGRQRDALPVLSGLHLLQGTRCDVWRSELVEDEGATAARNAWYADCPTPAWRPGETAWLATGTTLTGLGRADTIASFALAGSTSDDIPTALGSAPLSRQGRTALRATNASGWAAIGAGVAMVVPTAVLRARHVRRQRARP